MPLSYIPAQIYDAGGDLKKQWFVFYSLPCQKTGKMKRIKNSRGINRHKTVEARRAAATELAETINRQLRAGGRPEKQPPKTASLLQAFDEVLAMKKATTKRSTWRNYLYLRKHLVEFLSKKKLADLQLHEFTAATAHEFRAFLLAHPERKRAKTVHNYETYLASVFAEQVRMERLEKNPFVLLRRLKFRSESRPVFSAAHARQVLQHCKKHQPQLHLFLLFLFYTLNRPDAVRQLKITDLDLQKRRIRFTAGQAKNARVGWVVMPAQLREAIELAGLPSCPANWYVFAQHDRPGPHCRSKDHFRTRHQQVLAEVGLHGHGYKLYSWKDTGAVKLYEAIKDLKRVSMQMLHSNVLVTTKYLGKLGVIFGNDDLESRYPDIET